MTHLLAPRSAPKDFFLAGVTYMQGKVFAGLWGCCQGLRGRECGRSID